ncbi:PAS domain-containing protein [Streptomyces scopuliridis]|uniref:PAS domain-containing protein n=1 Tax=Streptomyces scopuliridis TaxID=452529 RepID=UPI0036A8D84D
MAALGFTERLPVGCCSLDLHGRLTFINSAGADLVGADALSLRGNRPWEVLPWMHARVSEDSYRAAVVTCQPTSFTAVRPRTHHSSSSSTPTTVASASASPPPRSRQSPRRLRHPASRPAQWRCTT